jgi:hypothetical protein
MERGSKKEMEMSDFIKVTGKELGKFELKTFYLRRSEISHAAIDEYKSIVVTMKNDDAICLRDGDLNYSLLKDWLAGQSSD